jgi:hypothetical protein
MGLEVYIFRDLMACLQHSAFILSYIKCFTRPPSARTQVSAWHLIATRKRPRIHGMLHIVWKQATTPIWKFRHHAMEMITPMILNCLKSASPVDLDQVSVRTSNWSTYTYRTTRKCSITYLWAKGMKCVGVLSYMKCSFRRMISGTSSKKSGILFPSPVSLFWNKWGLNSHLRELTKLNVSFSGFRNL